MGKDSPKPVRGVVCACVYFLVLSEMMININGIIQKWNKQSQRDIKIVCLPFLCFHRILKIVTITIIVNLRSGLVLVALIHSFLGGRAFKTWARIGGVVVGGVPPPVYLVALSVSLWTESKVGKVVEERRGGEGGVFFFRNSLPGSTPGSIRIYSRNTTCKPFILILRHLRSCSTEVFFSPMCMFL